MNIVKSLIEKSKSREDKLKREEIEDIINVSIVNGRLMIVIRNYHSFIALDPSLFKDENVETIVEKIRNDNYAKLKA